MRYAVSPGHAGPCGGAVVRGGPSVPGTRQLPHFSASARTTVMSRAVPVAPVSRSSRALLGLAGCPGGEEEQMSFLKTDNARPARPTRRGPRRPR